MEKFIKIVQAALLLALFLPAGMVEGQAPGGPAIKRLSLPEAYEMLELRYPSLQNAPLLASIHEKEGDKISQARLPVIYLKADGRAQTQSTQLTVPEGASLPFEINQPLVSAKAYVEAQYVILDGGMGRASREVLDAQFLADLQGLEVERYSLRDRVNQLALGILLLQEQDRLFELSLADIAARKEAVAAGVAQGLLLESELVRMEVRELEIAAQRDNLRAKRKGFAQSLSYLLGREVSVGVRFDFPEMPDPIAVPALDRPEQRLFQLQKEALVANTKLFDAARRPKLSAYAQAGTGYPNPLNILDNNVAPFGLVGAQFSFQLTDWRKSRTEKESLGLRAQQIDNVRKTFEFNLQSQEANYLAEVDRLQGQIILDQRIAVLQAQVLAQLSAQLDEGVITSSDYLEQVNAELRARQNLLIHETELLQVQLDFWNQRGGIQFK